ncbi:hypothetical protein [Galactobacillus timonensis]|uniref:hypothetical protein n=1 Tax=Galactobacillus timonensis TaxID=2041840 RepID=UPI0023F12C60|nr:hypothetical protein [Galactobacillus timonensis]MCI6754205.1 hypothetical protein [Galactobacillus timonensis]
MKRVFISQPMNGRSNEEIKAEREYIAYKIEEYYKHEKKEPVQVIDSFFEDAPHDAKPLWFLGKSLELLSTADIAVFAKGWRSARGCMIEHECAVAYGIETIEED